MPLFFSRRFTRPIQRLCCIHQKHPAQLSRSDKKTCASSAKQQPLQIREHRLRITFRSSCIKLQKPACVTATGQRDTTSSCVVSRTGTRKIIGSMPDAPRSPSEQLPELPGGVDSTYVHREFARAAAPVPAADVCAPPL